MFDSFSQASFVTSLREESSAVTLRFSSSVAKLALKWQIWSSGLVEFHTDTNLLNNSTLMSPFRTLDTDNNGYLDFTEFLLAMDLVAAR